MKPRKMQPRVCWALVDKDTGAVQCVYPSRKQARDGRWKGERVVRVRVTEAP